MEEMNEIEQASIDMINRFKKDQKIYEEYLKFIDSVCMMIKLDFMLNCPKNEQELAERIEKALKFAIDKHYDWCFFLKKNDLNIIGALITNLIKGNINDAN